MKSPRIVDEEETGMNLPKKAFTTAAATLFAALCLCAGPAAAQGSQPVNARIALPPLGWSSWNSFSNTIDSGIAIEQARAMAASGLQKAGYQYINIDEGWWLGERDADGNIVVDPKAWPAIEPGEKAGDMSNIVRAIHKLGLKAGIYTDAGKEGCSMYPDLGPAYFHVGSEGHYEQDFLQFARWGFDYVKVDWCGGDKGNLDPAVQYGEIARAIARAEQIGGKRLYYSICNWGSRSPWSWGPGVGAAPQSIWRTSGDIVDPVVAGSVHAGKKVAFEKMLANFDQGIHPEAQHTGYYNDPDMMVLGMPGLTAAQNRLHLALWAVSSAPLLVGADLTKLDAETLAALTNPDTIAIDQDPLGLQAFKAKEISSGLEVWSKFLAQPGARAVVLLNRTYFPAPMSVKWADLGLAGDSATVRDVFAGKDLGALPSEFKTTIPAQDGVLLLVRGTEGSFRHYTPAAPKTAEEQAIRDPETRFAQVAASSAPWAQVRIVYANPSPAPRLAELRVNGQTATRILFPPTGSGLAAVWIEAQLDRPGAGNVLNFATDAATGVAIESIDVH
ncbi:MAG: alpha-galactosidase [Terracidiphilus sp.]